MKFEKVDIKSENGIREDLMLELYFSMNETQLLHYYEPELGLFVVESPMVIERALSAGYEPVSFVMIDKVADEMCRKFGEMVESDITVPVYTADYDTIADLTGVNISRGVLALFKRRELPELSDVLSGCRRIAVFDDVENPTNIGAMFRSAAALGIEADVVTGNSSDPLYRRASRVSVGTVFQVPWTKVSKKDYMKRLKELGFKTAAMALNDKSVGIDDPCLKEEEKLAIILGNEGYGLKEEVIESCDHVVKIPMKHNVDSLNVAAAASVVFWEVMRSS